MRIAAAALERFGGSLADGVGNGRMTWGRREGLLLRLMDEDGEIGQGEASPLPGYSREGIGDAADALRRVPWHLLPPLEVTAAPDARFPPFWQRCMELLDEALPAASLPSARFAAEAAIVDLAGRSLDTPAHALLRAGRSAAPVHPIALNAWLRDAAGDAIDIDAVLAACRAATARGIGIVKLKVGRAGRFEEERRMVAAVRGAFGTALGIRLDANGAWGDAEARRHLESLAPFAPEYIEQPVSADALPAFTAGALPIAVAADESLRDPVARATLLARRGTDAGCCRVLMLKPMVLGGFDACMGLAREARTAGLDLVVSHLLDGPVALAAACELALALDPPPRASGLDPHPGLGAWPGMRVPQLDGRAVVPTTRPGLGLALLPPAPAATP